MMSFGDLVITLIAFSWLILAYCCLKIGELDAKKKYNKLDWVEERDFKRYKIFAGISALLCLAHLVWF